MADIYGYMYTDSIDGETVRKIKLRSQDGSVTCGCRFKYMAEEIPANYDSLVKALNDAIDKVAKEKGAQFVTDQKNDFKINELDYTTVMNSFKAIIDKIVSSHSAEEMETIWTPKIVQITEKYLGKGKKASECTRDQVEQLNLIVLDLEDLTK